MVLNAAQGKEDIRSVNTEQECSHTELKYCRQQQQTGLFNFSYYSAQDLYASLQFQSSLNMDESRSYVSDLEFPELHSM